MNKTFGTVDNLRLGISPGVTFFAMENFAFEVQLNLLGYNLAINNKTVKASINPGKSARMSILKSISFRLS